MIGENASESEYTLSSDVHICGGEINTIIYLKCSVQSLTECGRKCAIIVIFSGQDCLLTKLHVHDETVKISVEHEGHVYHICSTYL